MNATETHPVDVQRWMCFPHGDGQIFQTSWLNYALLDLRDIGRTFVSILLTSRTVLTSSTFVSYMIVSLSFQPHYISVMLYTFDLDLINKAQNA